MLRFALRISEFVPAMIFAAIAAFIAARLAVNLYPSTPYSWQAFMVLSPIGREISNLLPLDTAWHKVFWSGTFLSLAVYAACLVGRAKLYSQRFVVFHSSLLVLLVAMSDERIFIASSQLNPDFDPARFINIAAITPGFAALLVGVCIACAKIHGRLLWNLRRPYREIAGA